MTNTPNPSREQPSTYMVQNRASQDELKRLLVQDQLVTAGMGGVLPEQDDPTRFQSVLDVGCGPGSWLIQLAREYPGIPHLVGIDISGKMIETAQQQAGRAKVDRRVEFLVMDALRGLKFAGREFDLVNLRLGDSWLRTWDWPELFQEFRCVTRPGGVMRITESDMLDDNGGSPALKRLSNLLLEALHQSGHYFAAEWNGMLDHLPRMLRQYAAQDVQTRLYRLTFPAGTSEGQYMLENVRHAFQTFQPFIRKWTRIPSEYDLLYEQALQEMQQPGFCASWNFQTTWGIRPADTEP